MEMTTHFDPEAYEQYHDEIEEYNEWREAKENGELCRHCEENRIEDNRKGLGSNVCQECADYLRDQKIQAEMMVDSESYFTF